MHATTKLCIPLTHCYTNNYCLSRANSSNQEDQKNIKNQVGGNMALNNALNYSGNSADQPDGLASCFGGCAPRRSDSLPSPTGRVAGFFSDRSPTAGDSRQLRGGHRGDNSPLADGDRTEQQHELDPVLFELTKVPPIELARELTLMFLQEFKAIQPDELTSVAWSKRDKLTRAPNVVKFTQLFNRINFWAQTCVLEARSLHKRAALLAHFVKIARRLVELQNLHAAFALVAALQSQPIYRLQRTWGLLPRKCSDAFQRMAELFSADSNYERLRRHMQDARLPFIPYLGMYMSDLVYIDSCYPSTGGLDSQARKDQMNNICRVISECQLSVYSFQSNGNIRHYLESQRYIEEMQTLIEATNHSLSLELEPKQSSDTQLDSDCFRDNCNAQFRQQNLPAIRLQNADGVRLRPSALDGAGLRHAFAGHRKSKSVGDASGMTHAVSNGSPACAVVGASYQQSGTPGAVVPAPAAALRPNGLDIRRNLIDDSLPVSAGDCSSLSLSMATPTGSKLHRSKSSSPSPHPPERHQHLQHATLLAAPSASASISAVSGSSDKSCSCCCDPAPGAPGGPSQAAVSKSPLLPPQLEQGGAAILPQCQGPLERKSVFKRGKRQSHSRYRRYWAELALTGSGPTLLLYSPCRRLLASGPMERRQFKPVFKHSQPLSDALVVPADAAANAGSAVRTFQINFDHQYEASGRHHASLSGQKLSSYKYRVCAAPASSNSRHNRPMPSIDDWLTRITVAIHLGRQEKALIDFNDAPPPAIACAALSTKANSTATAASSHSGSIEWTCL